MPKHTKLNTRTSTINNSFAMSIIPYKKETDQAKLKAYYEELEIEEGQCAYCMRKGEAKTGDHLHPLTKDKLPSGYLTDINNIIPCCKDCNSKKGGKEFEDWYLSEKNKERLRKLGLSDSQIQERYGIIMKYISNHSPEPLDLKSIVGEEDWNKFLRKKDELEKLLKEDQEFCNRLSEKIANASGGRK